MVRIFEFMGVKIQVTSLDAEPIRFCKEYFNHFFDCYEPQKGDDHVTYSVEIGDSFVGDKDYVLVIENPFVVYVNYLRRKIKIFGLKEEMYIELMRLIRELFFSLITSVNDCCFLHAACVANDEMAIAITGNKFAGKTTMCLNLLRHGWGFVSNDKLILHRKNHAITQCYGLPISLRIREGTKELYSDKLGNMKFDEEDNRYYLSPSQLLDRFSVKVNNGKALKMILIPHLMPYVEKITLRKMSDAESKSILLQQSLDALYAEEKKIKLTEVFENRLILSDLNVPMYEVYISENCNDQLAKIVNKYL